MDMSLRNVYGADVSTISKTRRGYLRRWIFIISNVEQSTS